MTLLEAKGIVKRFGGVTAVKDCSFTVREGSITSLIGPNGAGKTTVFNIITGIVRPDAGEVRFRGEQLVGMESHEIFRMGIARTFQMLRIFPKLTALENVMIAQPGRAEGMFDCILRPGMVHGEEAARRERAMEHLAIVGLDGKADATAGSLSYGQQKLLDIARCLATESSLILLDEPVAGVNPVLREKIRKLLLDIRSKGRTVLLVEHDMTFVMGISDEVIVLDHGEEIAVGPPKRIRNDRRVIKAYLGE